VSALSSDLAGLARHRDRASARAACAHCGEPVADAGDARYCCTGCAAAAEWIRSAGLSDYYRLREASGGLGAGRVGDAPADYAAWDREELQRAHVLAVGDAREIGLALEGMRCAACAWLVDRALAREPGVREASANAVTGRLRLRWDPARTQLSRVLARLDALGYRPFLAGGEALELERRRERNALLLRLGIAGLAAMQAMMFSEAAWLGDAQQMALPTRDFFRWLTLLACTPVVFFSGLPFLTGMRRELALRRPGMDTLAALSILLAYGASVVETLRGGPQVWFDAAAMFVLFLLVARLLERAARLRAGARLELLARARPELAWRRRADGGLEQVALAALALGDELHVAADAAVPADGTLLDADASFDEALLTGEATACPRRAGDRVLAGSIALGTPARVRVLALGEDTRLAQIQRLVARAQAQRPALARAADRLATRFVLAMFAASALAALAWWPQGGAQAFAVGLAVLVAACPCALALAVPATLSSAVDALARRGVLVLGADALERLADVDTVLLDKTGTLTRGRPALATVECFDATTRDHALELAAALERDSRHPLAAAFAGAAAPLDAQRLLPGLGVEGWRDGARHRLGRADFAAGHTDDGAVWLAREGRALARFTFTDPLRDDAREVVAAMRALGLAVTVASGDAPDAVAAACAQAGVADARARLLPEDKLACLRELQARGHRVLAVGDGINDAPLLAGADVSVALGGGSALAQRSADLLLLGERLAPLAEAIHIARDARRVLRQNLAWAIAYNALAIALAASGLVHPGWAALGMAGSSLGVTLNALRVGRRRA
jgi:Cu2+-exporting ATPase